MLRRAEGIRDESRCKDRGLIRKPLELAQGARRLLAVAMLGLLAQDALAEPAAYWRWRSTSNGQEFCTQTSPGPGWTRSAGPFRDLQCREPGSVPLRRWAEPPQRRF